MELPDDFRHQPPEGYRYEVIRKNANVVAIWTVCNPGFVYNDGNDVRCIWGFYNPKKRQYFAPINSNKVGESVDFSKHHALQRNATQPQRTRTTLIRLELMIMLFGKIH